MKKSVGNTIELQRQKNMMRLIQRYATLINQPNTFVLLHSWNVAFLDLDKPDELQYDVFQCYTNNIAFASMLFEAALLPQKITIAYMEYNNLVQ